MLFNIKSKIDGKILFELETSSFELCIEAAVRTYANLRSADLRNANLRNAELGYAVAIPS